MSDYEMTVKAVLAYDLNFPKLVPDGEFVLLENDAGDSIEIPIPSEVLEELQEFMQKTFDEIELSAMYLNHVQDWNDVIREFYDDDQERS